ncbi:ABC transporter permease [Fusibacter sp. 3D3]|uniref:ABC transporter permease n=1 Tax=Fusibacter sp. 3D3 TaxID=1048380 RepID=UPI0008535AD2|nr:ABC transporter permease [Fusibacter sp. 3D3]GAU79479.1 dipeptide transport system permease protein DppB [Fusibacter sp. 3D3]
MRYLIKKTGSAIITLVIVSFMTFGIFELIPGDPVTAKLGIEADQEQIEALIQEHGLDKPFIVRYKNWVISAIKGDLGMSLRFDEPVTKLIKDRVKVTAMLTILSLSMTIMIAVPLSIFIAKYNNKLIGILTSIATQVGMAVPSFWVGIMMTYFFGLTLRLFIPGRYVSVDDNFTEGMLYLFFPAVAIAIPKIATVIRYLRNAIVEQLEANYVRTAYAKGFVFKGVMYRHVLRNALIPVITIMGMMIADVLGGSLIIEQVFTIPGIGRLLVMAINNRDYFLVQGMVLYIATIIIGINFLVDLIYHWIDPRIKIETL